MGAIFEETAELLADREISGVPVVNTDGDVVGVHVPGCALSPGYVMQGCWAREDALNGLPRRGKEPCGGPCESRFPPATPSSQRGLVTP